LDLATSERKTVDVLWSMGLGGCEIMHYSNIQRSKLLYSELQVTTNYSFLRSGSHPEELVARAAALGYSAIGITDWMTLGGIVRAHTAAKQHGIKLLIGCALPLCGDFLENQRTPFHALVYPTTKSGYEELSVFISRIHTERLTELSSSLFFQNLLQSSKDFVVIIPVMIDRKNRFSNMLSAFVPIIREYIKDNLYIGISRTFSADDADLLAITRQLSVEHNLPLVVTNDVRYHTPERRIVLDALTCVRMKITIQDVGTRILPHGEHYLKSPHEMYRLFREIPEAVARTEEIVEKVSSFSLDQLWYEYPEITDDSGSSQLEELVSRVFIGAAERFLEGIPPSVERALEEEIHLIQELRYEKYFLTCHEIVLFARSRDILCQGRGAAANSVVCYCLGITAVNPLTIDLLFARFVSKERQEPPDIDIDFEHERREEVIQFIYERFGREHAALTAEIITYRFKSALTDMGKVCGLDSATITQIAESSRRWSSGDITAESLSQTGLDPHNLAIKKTLQLTTLICGFPRHRSQHVGGFIISKYPLNRIVPIIPATMAARAIIEWDKDDIEELGILKIDILALGMLSCLRRSFSLINAEREKRGEKPVALYTIPTDDTQTYDMIGKADTIGVFQIESRAQMSMLPRLRPRCYYDLVIEVAIVRPGPIHGDMVHPYLRRRFGKERVTFPDENVKAILGKTLGVPLFQEQAMRLAICLAGFSPGEAEQLRRAMAAWKRHEDVIQKFKARIIEGMLAHGYSRQFAETCMHQIRGFSEYGFPESHAASFALLVLASAWIKKHYPAEFCASLLNSQPMGFYAPAQIIQDAKNHGVVVESVDINKSDWETTIEDSGSVRIGMHLIKGIEQRQGELIALIVKTRGFLPTIQDLWNAAYETASFIPLRRETLVKLAQADAFQSMGLSRREALWEIRGLTAHPIPLKELDDPIGRSRLPLLSFGQQVSLDYESVGFSAKAHPISLIRPILNKDFNARSWQSIAQDSSLRHGATFTVAGLVISRQRPDTAKGIVFLSLEDETGITNIIVSRELFEQNARAVIHEPALVVRGALRRIGPVVYCVAASVRGIGELLDEVMS